MAVYILAYDLGTTGDKATLFDEREKLVTASFETYVTISPKAGWAEQAPDDYWFSAVHYSLQPVQQRKR